jgi:starch phosphorylase
VVDHTLPHHQQDLLDAQNLLDLLEDEILPVYYDQPERWNGMVAQSLTDVVPYFDSDRMAEEYYQKQYDFKLHPKVASLERD